MVFVVDNYDAYTDDYETQRKLERAKSWEKAFIEFVKEWEKNPENTKLERTNMNFFSMWDLSILIL